MTLFVVGLVVNNYSSFIFIRFPHNQLSGCCCLHLISDICLLMSGPDHDDGLGVPLTPGAGQSRAEQEPQGDQHQPQTQEAGPHHPQLQGPEASLPEPHRGDDHPYCHQHKAQVQQNVNVSFLWKRVYFTLRFS